MHTHQIDRESVATSICGLWPSLTASQRSLLADHLSVSRYKRGEMIYGEGDSTERMYFLISGKVKVIKAGVCGRGQIIRAVKPIEIFGYRAHFAHAMHRSRAIALESSTVASVPMSTIERLMLENPPMALRIVHHLAVLLGQSDERTVNLTQKHIRGRLAEALLFLRDNYGLEEDGSTLSIYLSREDLANLSNMTTSNAIRTLSSFANEQVISIDGKKIKLVDMDELLRISKMG